MKTYKTYSEAETKDVAFELAKKINKGVIALTGELGTGKTTFAAGFAKGLGIKDKIISPTFVLIRQHKIPNSRRVLFHIDLYRLENIKELGIEELLNSENITIIEWAEKIEKKLPKETIRVSLEKVNKGRLITVS